MLGLLQAASLVTPPSTSPHPTTPTPTPLPHYFAVLLTSRWIVVAGLSLFIRRDKGGHEQPSWVASEAVRSQQASTIAWRHITLARITPAERGAVRGRRPDPAGQHWNIAGQAQVWPGSTAER